MFSQPALVEGRKLREKRRDNGFAAVNLKFRAILAGEGRWTRENQNETLIDDMTVSMCESISAPPAEVPAATQPICSSQISACGPLMRTTATPAGRPPLEKRIDRIVDIVCIGLIRIRI